MHKRSTLFLSLVKVVVVVVAVVACDPHGCNGRQTAKKMNRKRPTEGTGERDETLQNCCGVVLWFFFSFRTRSVSGRRRRRGTAEWKRRTDVRGTGATTAPTAPTVAPSKSSKKTR